jgi:outer membrane receptor protein involved in Fe transport
MLTTASAHAQTPPDEEIEDGGDFAPSYAPESPKPSSGTVTTTGIIQGEDNPGSSSSTVTAQELAERLPRSAPDALRYEPGVFVQQTAHSQGSAFIRGRTGQQTILAFDEVRLNNSLFRQGPNQYFFTIDARSIDHIDITRGSSSTRHGTDAIAGAINAVPITPTLDPTRQGLHLSPSLSYRLGTADGEHGGRVQLGAQLGPRVAVLAGVGSRNVGQLESAGPIFNPDDGERPQVPRFAEDGRTQLGTGFDEVTADTRLLFHIAPHIHATLAAYTYRQYDAPRTDQCPPAYAPFDECLKYDEQFRDLIYGSIDANWGSFARTSRLIISTQRQHEARSYDRPGAQAINRGQDDVSTTGILWKAQSKGFELGRSMTWKLRHGFDYYRDRVTSTAQTELLNLGRTFESSRGQYLSGSSYAWGGVWAEPEVVLWKKLVLRAGGRLSHISAQAPRDEESGTLGVQSTWTPVVGNLGAELWLTEFVTLHANADQGFRAPNLDDLTSRQRTGPGFQIENAALQPERGVTLESGVTMRHPGFELGLWGFRSTLRDAMIRTTRDIDACPPNTPECRTTWARLQLVNLPGEATILGTEGNVRINLSDAFTLTSSISYAYGEGPTPLVQAENAERVELDRVPLSRIPPLNGTSELMWRHARGIYLGGSLRWAATQDRLAISDISDERIPLGGTPGFAVVDARAGWRVDANKGVHAVVENLLDSPYRYHGSSTNGAGRSLTLQAEIGW